MGLGHVCYMCDEGTDRTAPRRAAAARRQEAPNSSWTTCMQGEWQEHKDIRELSLITGYRARARGRAKSGGRVNSKEGIGIEQHFYEYKRHAQARGVT